MSDQLIGGLGPAGQEAESEKAFDGLVYALLIQLLLLALAFVTGRFLEKIKFKWMGEAGSALLISLVVGVVLWAAGLSKHAKSAVAFQGDVFFYVLLPVIMFDAGFGLDTRMFIKNVGSICLYAFAGTTISCFVIGLMMWAFGKWGWCYRMGLLENLTFGALISATDPVTVLAVFNRLHAQPDLYINVFGESVLNDAVGMVLYRVLSAFVLGKAVTAGNVFVGIAMFLGIFLGSMAIGLAVGLLAALIFKSRYFYSGPSTGEGQSEGHGSSTFEVGLAFVFAYGSYVVADAAKCSGIVAVVTNGMLMSMYVKPNLSEEAAHKIENLFKVLAGLFELFVFCYIGSSLFLQTEKYNIFGYTALCLLALAVSRAANIYPLSLLCNTLRPMERHITQKEQLMMWWSGLRGAMAFALAVDASETFGEAGQVMKTCTFYIVFVTVLVNGGTAAELLEKLKLRASDVPSLLVNAECDTGGFGGGGGGGEEAEGGDGQGYQVGRRLRPMSSGGGHRKVRNADEAVVDEEAASGLAPLGSIKRPSSQRRSSIGAPGERQLGRSISSRILERVRSMNDGRLVDKFNNLDKKIAKILVHPEARREAEAAAAAAVARGGGRGGGTGLAGAGIGAISAPVMSHAQAEALGVMTTPSENLDEALRSSSAPQGNSGGSAGPAKGAEAGNGSAHGSRHGRSGSTGGLAAGTPLVLHLPKQQAPQQQGPQQGQHGGDRSNRGTVGFASAFGAGPGGQGLLAPPPGRPGASQQQQPQQQPQQQQQGGEDSGSVAAGQRLGQGQEPGPGSGGLAPAWSDPFLDKEGDVSQQQPPPQQQQ